MLSLKLNLLGAMLLQEAVGFDLITMWTNMGILAKGVVAILAIMSAWSIGVMIDRFLAFGQARKQSREFAPSVAGCLREGKIEEAISVAEQNKRSHLAKVVEAGLQEFRAHGISQELAGEQIESSRRACERAEAIVNAELKRGLSGLATIERRRLSWGCSALQLESSMHSREWRLQRAPVFPRSPVVFRKPLLPRHLGCSSRCRPYGPTTSLLARLKHSVLK